MTLAQNPHAEGESLRKACALVREGQVEAALAAVAGEQELLTDLVRWFALTQKRAFGTFSEMRRFVQAHKHWPDQDLLRATLETSINLHTSLSEDDLHWLNAHPPQEGGALLAYATQIKGKVSREKLRGILRSLLARAHFSEEEARAFLLAFQSYLSPQDMLSCADALLWARKTTTAGLLLPLVPEAERPLLKARIQLLKGDPKTTHRPPELLEQFRSAPSFAYAILYLEHKQDKIKHAPTLIKETPFSWKGDHHSSLTTEMQYVVRELIREKRFSEAYQVLVRATVPTTEDAYSDAQLLAGWIALRRLKRPKDALKHFSAVEKSDSYRYRARALYWKARTLQALGRKKESHDALERCAVYRGVFWGQLACLALRKPIAFAALKEGDTSSLRSHKHVPELLRAASLMTRAQEDAIAGKFIVLAGGSLTTQEDITCLLEEAAKISSYAAIQVYLSQASKGLYTPYALLYPTLPIQNILGKPSDVEDVFSLSIIRSESGFSERIVAPGNLGMGYMQLMPYTAEEVAQRHAFEKYAFQKLFDGPYNILLGTTHLAELLEHFHGCYPLAIAAYNAGIAAVERWIRNNGDPRTKEIDMVDWIECIPYRITRLYVQKVLTDMQYYAHLLQKKGFDLPTLLGRTGL
ncbi:MAG: lytic transglycosylase domain-containing protein [Holosporales bacterium]|nr:lytic transglycosylase domain-containing protein [Holosporales bacterium]